MKKKLTFSCSMMFLFTVVGCSDTAPVVNKLEVVDPKVSYIVDSDFLIPTVMASYSDGSKKDVSKYAYFTGYNMYKAGEYTVSVSYHDVETSYDIVVKDKQKADYSIVSKLIEEDENCTKVKHKYIYKDFINNNVYPTSSIPSTIETKLLVIPVWFTDSSLYIEEDKKELVRSDINASFFGSEEEVGWESLKTYYYKDSFGHSNVSGIVTPWYECNKSSKNYYNYYTRTYSLVANAVEWYKEYSGETLEDFDSDKDGYLDGVAIIYGAPNYQSLQNWSADNLWAYTSWLMQESYKSTTNPGPNVFFWGSYDFMYDLNTAVDRTGNTYGFGDCSNCKLDSHTFIHETGHMYGLDDYYDYTGQNSFAAGFSMQDLNIGAHDPFSRYALGWTTPYVPTESMTFTVKPIEESGQFVLLANEFNGSPFGEYILLELYTPTGLNEFDTIHHYVRRSPGPSIPGVRVWHVDARLFAFNENYTNGKITNNASLSRLILASDNSSYEDENGKKYAGSYEYNLLHLIRNNKEVSWKNSRNIHDEDLFKTGDTFSISNYQSQFANGELMNNGKAFNWTVYFDQVDASGMTITVTYEK